MKKVDEQKKKIAKVVFFGMAFSTILALFKPKEISKYNLTQNLKIEKEIVNEQKVEYIDDYVSENDFTSLDDIIVSYEEQGMNFSPSANESINNLYAIENENSTTPYFNINKEIVEKQYMDYVAQRKNIKHKNSRLYDEENNTILWDEAVNIVLENSKKAAGGEYTSLSQEEIKYLIDVLKEFILNLQKDYPKLDIEEIACKLESYVFLYDTQNYTVHSNQKLFATATHLEIVYYDENQDIRTFDPLNVTSIHEFFHFVCFGCDCKHDHNMYYADGINLISPLYFIDKNTGKQVNFYDSNMNNYNFTFIEEATAERVMYNYTDEMSLTYTSYKKVCDTIEFVLSLNDNYQIDSYVEDLIYHEPIKFVRSFPVGNENEKENFADNIRMLSIYDALLKNTIDSNGNHEIRVCFNDCENIEEKKQKITELLSFSQSQLTKLFFSNMIVLNENHGHEIDYDYYLFLTQTFYGRMQQINRMVAKNWDLSDEVQSEYTVYFNEMKNQYVQYLCNYTKSPISQGVFTFANWKIESGQLPDVEAYPEYLPKDRIQFYNFICSELVTDELSISRKLSLQKE